jgi:hypothetical protein
LAIAPNPKRNTMTVSDSKAESFISGAGKAEPEEVRGRQRVLIGFPIELLTRIDTIARKKGISRAAYVVSSMADLVNGER